MANYIGNCITPKLGSRHIAKVLVPTGGLKAGQLVICDTINTTIAGNFEVYTATQPTTAALGTKHLAIVINGGVETLSDGRRPAGQPDFTKYEYAAGEIADVVFIDSHLTFVVGTDSVSGGSETASSDIGKYIIPANNTNVGAVNASATSIGCPLKIQAIYNYPLGGLYGGQFATAYVCTAE